MSMFNDLANNRKAATAASMQFGIFKIRKDGTPSAKPTSTTRTEEEAIYRRDYIASLNPGSTFVVKGL